MRISCVLLTLFVGAVAPLPLHAQATPMDLSQLAAMQASAMQQNKPAEFVLQHRIDLGLAASQVTALEVLVVAQRDSARTRLARMADRMRANPVNAALVAAVGWSGPVDDAAVRDALCQQSAAQLELILGLAWDRRAVASVLTPTQVAQLPRIQADELTKAIRRP